MALREHIPDDHVLAEAASLGMVSSARTGWRSALFTQHLQHSAHLHSKALVLTV